MSGQNETTTNGITNTDASTSNSPAAENICTNDLASLQYVQCLTENPKVFLFFGLFLGTAVAFCVAIAVLILCKFCFNKAKLKMLPKDAPTGDSQSTQDEAIPLQRIEHGAYIAQESNPSWLTQEAPSDDVTSVLEGSLGESDYDYPEMTQFHREPETDDDDYAVATDYGPHDGRIPVFNKHGYVNVPPIKSQDDQFMDNASQYLVPRERDGGEDYYLHLQDRESNDSINMGPTYLDDCPIYDDPTPDCQNVPVIAFINEKRDKRLSHSYVKLKSSMLSDEFAFSALKEEPIKRHLKISREQQQYDTVGECSFGTYKQEKSQTRKTLVNTSKSTRIPPPVPKKPVACSCSSTK